MPRRSASKLFEEDSTHTYGNVDKVTLCSASCFYPAENNYICTVMAKRKISIGKLLLIQVLLAVASFSESTDHPKPNPIVEHVRNSHVWHLATVGDHHYTLYLPVVLYKKGEGFFIFSSSRFWKGHHLATYKGFKLNTHTEKIEAVDGSTVYDLSLTRDLANVLISILLLLLLFLSMARYYTRAAIDSPPKGMWALLAYFVCFVRDHIAKENIGPKHYERFTPYLLTIFWFIWLNNTLGLLPGAGNVTGNISVTFVLASFTFLVTNLNGSRDYWSHILSPPGVPKWLLPIMVPTELLGLLTKTITLMMRLFANMLAGHLVLLSIISMIFILKTIFASIIVVPLGTFMIFLKLGVAFLQAYIFTLLSAISIGGAVATHEEDHAQHEKNLTH